MHICDYVHCSPQGLASCLQGSWRKATAVSNQPATKNAKAKKNTQRNRVIIAFIFLLASSFDHTSHARPSFSPPKNLLNSLFLRTLYIPPTTICCLPTTEQPQSAAQLQQEQQLLRTPLTHRRERVPMSDASLAMGVGVCAALTTASPWRSPPKSWPAPRTGRGTSRCRTRLVCQEDMRWLGCRGSGSMMYSVRTPNCLLTSTLFVRCSRPPPSIHTHTHPHTHIHTHVQVHDHAPINSAFT
jgi:hypothetical protein